MADPSAWSAADPRNSLGAARADQQDRARLAVGEGRHVRLSVVVRKLKQRLGGAEMDAGLEQWNGRTVYRVRWTAKGRRADYLADAQTGHVLGRAPS